MKFYILFKYVKSAELMVYKCFEMTKVYLNLSNKGGIRLGHASVFHRFEYFVEVWA